MNINAPAGLIFGASTFLKPTLLVRYGGIFRMILLAIELLKPIIMRAGTSVKPIAIVRVNELLKPNAIVRANL